MRIHTVLWIVQGLLSVAMIAAGGMKLGIPKEMLVKRGQGWAADFSARSVKLIGFAEVAGGLGLVVPGATGIAPILTPIAAVCLVALMIGAAGVNVRRHDNPAPPLVLAALAAVIAVGRVLLWS